MKISIILITYNQENYIQKAVESILMQEVDCEIEIIVADDFSIDKTVNNIKTYLDKSKKNTFYLESEKNLGHPQNYKRAFSKCSGDYIAILEGDDYWTDPKRLQMHIDFLESHRECVMTMNRLIIYEEYLNEYTVQEWYCSESYEYINGQRLARGNCLGNLSACVIRKSVLNNLNDDIFDLDIDDWLLGLGLSKYGLIAKLKEPLSVYRRHDKGQWAGKSELEVKVKLLERIETYNHYFDYMYNNDFNILKHKLQNSDKNTLRLKNFLPPALFAFLKYIIPPIFVQKLHK